MKKMNENQLQNLEGGKFWGKTCGPEIHFPNGDCTQYCVFFAFWIRLSEGFGDCGSAQQ